MNVATVARRAQTQNRLAGKISARPKSDIWDQVCGMWKGRKPDAVAYQRRIRRDRKIG